jgi:uncharacterized protein
VTALAVRVQPGARRAGIRGWMEDGALKLAVTAPPEGGRANEAVIELLARALSIGARDLSVKRGRTSRAKVIEVEGLTAVEIRRRIERAMSRANGESDGE